MNQIEWIAVDWGTSHFRAWAMTADVKALAFADNDQGMGKLQSNEFEATLLNLINAWLDDARRIPVIACGMVGAKQGWREAGYQSVPCIPEGELARVMVKDPRIAVYICPGLQQLSDPDVMRGEETQIAGLLAQNPRFEGVVCLPGTHTKWARVQQGQVIEFQTFMTGELFGLLSTYSVLRHSVMSSDWDYDAFDEACQHALADPIHITSYLFKIRAASLLDGLAASKARAMLSGYLIGLELAASQPYWCNQTVAIIGDQLLSRLYCTALKQHGVNSQELESERLTLMGLARNYRTIVGVAA